MSAAADDLAFMSELEAATRSRPPLLTSLFLVIVALVFAGLIGWAAYAHIDEVAVGNGKVIPSSQVQVIQNLEGGILAELLVREGTIVESGQVLLRVDDTGFQSEFRQNRAKLLALEGQIARLVAEAEGRDIAFPASVLAERGDVAETERQLYQSRQRELQSALEGLRQQIEQRKQELSSLRSRDKFLTESLTYVRQELSISSELAEKGYRSKIEVLRLQRNVTDLTGQLQSTRIAIPQAQAALSEAEQKLDERRQGFRSLAFGELSQRKAELASLSEVQRAQADRVSRREVRSPVHGMIKTIKVHTVGGVIPPGGELMEIVPLDDQMIIEARVSPTDIAFIRPGQKATVKLTAYDYSIYGGLDAELEHISADSILTERNEPYYLIRVRTTRSYLGSEDRRLAVIPGMVASVDIVTGDKTVLQYLMKPILKTAERALRER